MLNKKDWRKDKTSLKYKRYLEKRREAMEKTHRKRLEKLNKQPLHKKVEDD